MKPVADERQAAVDAEAADWLVRLRGNPLNRRDRRELDQWLQASVDHRKAFELARKAWGLMGEIPLPAPEARPTSRWQTPVALAAGFLIAVAGLTLYRMIPWFALDADHYAPVGTIRPLTLPDGSVATLESRSAISVAYDESARRVRMLRGSAHFQVAPVENAASRPFIVEAAGGAVRALGTRFIVSQEKNAATVEVIEHSVLITSRADATGAGLVLREGERTRLTASGSVDRPERASREPAAWLRGHLVFDHTAVSDALVEINRFRRTPIFTLSHALERRNISGVFRIDDLDGAGQLIGRELNARAVEIPLVGTLLY